MHDIDRTQMEFSGETGSEMGYEMFPELGQGEFGEYEGEYGLGEYEGEYGYGEIGQEGPFSEQEEMELAAELLSVNNEQELEQFLGSLIKKVGGAVSSFANSAAGKALGGILKSVAKKALPMVGGAIGSFIAPGVGTALGSQLGSAAGRMFGLELEGMSAEDGEFEVARRYVRFAGDAARSALQAPPGVPTQQAVQNAVIAAAQKYAPGLIANPAGAPNGYHHRLPKSGRWIRRGRVIILLGL